MKDFIMQHCKIIKAVSFFLVIIFCAAATGAHAVETGEILELTPSPVQDLKREFRTWSLDYRELSLFEGKLNISWLTKTPTNSVIVRAYSNESAGDLPWKLKLISPVFDINLDGAPNGPINVTVKYAKANNYFKQLYYFDNQSLSWKALPSTDVPEESLIRAVIKEPQVRIAVFVNEEVLTVGKASWYAYKPGMFCASPDFPKGSRLRVTNTETGKSIEVTVNDWGPERKLHPDRVVDLSKEAFKEIAPLGQGVAKVSVSPIDITPDRYGRVLGVKEEAVASQPKLTAREAIVFNEDTGKTLLSKNSGHVVPIASLTKIVAAAVYLKHQPDLNLKVDYQDRDAKFNGLYAPLSEAALINFKNNDRMLAKDMLYAALVASANNAVESLVRVSGLSREQFVEEMNALVKSWGALDTRFTEPSGLSAKNVSSAKDYAIITREAFKDPAVKEATTTAKYTIKFLNRPATKTITNTNQLIVDQAQENLKLAQLGINGSKTGYTKEAGYCLMTRVKSVNGQFTIVTFGAPSRETSFSEMMDLIKYAYLKS